MSKTKKTIDKSLPEGPLNPAVGGVYVRNADPIRWFKVVSIKEPRITTTMGYGSTNSDIGAWLKEMEPHAPNYTYFPAGSAGAKEAVRDPRRRLRDLLRGLGRLV